MLKGVLALSLRRVRGIRGARWIGRSAQLIMPVGLSLAAVAMPGTAAAQAAELARVTVVTGSATGSMPVHLSNPAELDPWNVAIEGAGRIFGFALYRDGDAQRVNAYAVHMNFCHSPGCTNADFHRGEHFGWVNSPGPGFTTAPLPAGDYHLQLITDGAPVKVTIPLVGNLPETVQLSPMTPAVATLTTPPQDLSLPAPAKAIYSAGSTQMVGRFGGLQIGVLWVNEPLPKEVNMPDVCAFPGRPGPTRFQFPCLRDDSINIFLAGSYPVGSPRGPLGVYDRYRSALFFGGATGPGVWSIGAYNNVAGPVIEGHLQLLWIDFLA